MAGHDNVPMSGIYVQMPAVSCQFYLYPRRFLPSSLSSSPSMSMEKNDYIVYQAKKWTRGGVDLSPARPSPPLRHDFNQTLTRLAGEGVAALRDVLFARYEKKPGRPHAIGANSTLVHFKVSTSAAKTPEIHFFFFPPTIRQIRPESIEILYRISNPNSRSKDRERVVRTRKG